MLYDWIVFSSVIQHNILIHRGIKCHFTLMQLIDISHWHLPFSRSPPPPSRPHLTPPHLTHLTHSTRTDTPAYCFDIVTTEREWTLCAESQENVQKWLKLLTRAVDEDVAILPDEDLLFKVKPKVDPMGILCSTDYSTTLKVSGTSHGICASSIRRLFVFLCFCVFCFCVFLIDGIVVVIGYKDII